MLAGQHPKLCLLLMVFLMHGACSAPRLVRPRLSVVDWDNYNQHEPDGPGTYAFGYDIEDPATDNVQFRNEERLANGTVTGSYGYLQPDGNIHIVSYVADHLGYRATVETRPRGGILKPVDVLAEIEEADIQNPSSIDDILTQNTLNNEDSNGGRRRRPFNQQNNYQYIKNKYANKKDDTYVINGNIAQAYRSAEPPLPARHSALSGSSRGFYDFYYVPPTPAAAAAGA